MNIKILHSWLLEYLETNAKPQDITKYLSLCGPSIERFEKVGNDYSYDIEITTNRVDCASVFGITREASAILPMFGFKAKLKPLNYKKFSQGKSTKFPVTIATDEKLNNRIMAVVIKNISHNATPIWMSKRLKNAGIRSLDSVIDITNYIMTEIGHPTHVFDYDRLVTKKIICRESKKGEKIVGLDDKIYTLPGGDIIFDDGTGTIIDLPGILGTKNSVVTPETKNILFFIDNNSPAKTRRTSMSLSIRSVAATLNEKGVDSELGEIALKRGIELYQNICGGKVEGGIFDINLHPYKPISLSIDYTYIDKKIGINIKKETIIEILTNLGFKPSTKGNMLKVIIPSWRINDVSLPEDIIEEIARIYGYFNLPTKIMTGKLPDPITNSPFHFEDDLKDIIKTLGGVEVYTLSLVSKNECGSDALKLKNPLGSDYEYLRTSLFPSLRKAALDNIDSDNPFFLFEISNIYLPKKGDLPTEATTLGGIFFKTEYRIVKGIVEEILDSLGLIATIKPEEDKDFKPSSSIGIYSDNNYLGRLGVTMENFIYFDFDLTALRVNTKTKAYVAKPKFPPQIEDINFELPKGSYLGEVHQLLKDVKGVMDTNLIDTYENTATFRIYYQDPHKTLNNNEVKKIRDQIIQKVKTKFGGSIKA